MSVNKRCKGCYERLPETKNWLSYCSQECQRLVEWEWKEARLLDTSADDDSIEKHRRRHPRYWRKRKLSAADKADIEAYRKTMAELRAIRPKQVKRERIGLDELIERDNGICWLCGGKVSKRGKLKDGVKWYEDKKYPTADHVIPLSRDGLHTWDNVKLAHLECNRIKGGKLIGANLVSAGQKR